MTRVSESEGRSALEAAIAWARDHNAETMLLDVTCDNRPARQLYESLGFEAVGDSVPLREGEALMKQPMSLTLRSA